MGFIYLWIRYHNKEKVNKVLKEKYDNSYSCAGGLIVGKSFMIILVVSVIALLIAAIVSLIK